MGEFLFWSSDWIPRSQDPCHWLYGWVSRYYTEGTSVRSNYMDLYKRKHPYVYVLAYTRWSTLCVTSPKNATSYATRFSWLCETLGYTSGLTRGNLVFLIVKMSCPLSVDGDVSIMEFIQRLIILVVCDILVGIENTDVLNMHTNVHGKSR